jgi:ATP-dependent Clp protease protease subunit
MIKYLVSLAMLLNIAYAKSLVLTEENSVVFNQQVSEEFVSKKTLEIILKSSKTSPIYLVLDTPGGSVMSGLRFIDVIKSLKIEVHTITLFAASMGYQIAQELGTRYITPSGTLMSHRGAVSGIGGQIPGELNSRLNFIGSILSGMSERASKRIGVTKEQYDASIVNELWSFGQQAVNTNQADQVINVTCSEKLVKETYEQEMFTIFGAAVLKFSKCPLISSPIGVEFKKEVKPENFDKIKNLLKSKKASVGITF